MDFNKHQASAGEAGATPQQAPLSWDPQAPMPPMPPPPPQGQFPYGATPRYGTTPQYGFAPYGQATGPYGYDPYGQFPRFPATMPGSVRAAQVISSIFGGLGLALTVLAGVIAGAGAAGAMCFGYLFSMILALVAIGFRNGGSGTRTTALVLASIEMVIGLGGMGAKQPPGALGLIASLVIVILLAQSGSAAWFKRPR
ncbi:hypothetical protein ACFV4K_17560 [Nocardia sp. NPDC059764]|uniref:hypothetical protein n=1 Tax=Nocardia sp. NPDC059764 TaxID=3346939 RepID=UPI00364BF2F8